MTPIHVPQIDETASYECWLENGLLVMFHVIIERSWRNYQHDRDTPPDEICETEYINLKIDSLFNEDGEVDLPMCLNTNDYGLRNSTNSSISPSVY